MHKLCLLLVASGVFFGESVGSTTGGDQAVVAAPNAGTVLRVGGASSDSLGLLRSHLEDRNAVTALFEKMNQLVSRATTNLWKDQQLFGHVRAGPREELNRNEVGRLIDTGRKAAKSEEELALWKNYDVWFRSYGKPVDLDALYRVFKGDTTLDKVFKRLAALRNIDDDQFQGMVALMHNKLAQEVSAKFGDKASTWMAERWMKMGLGPAEVATMLGIGNKNLAFPVLRSAARWVDYVKMLQKKHSKLAIDTEKATSLLISHLPTDKQISLLRKVWPDNPIVIRNQLKKEDWLELFVTG
ncbi:unnamed protein product [Hyaloperonospora brassicae]|uniref:RxLR effector protein n=1 Tax=Hyaloperonospora brassicae TaxID=162125 RepID=A0AAV0U543_HYABA|nr:unnamed protein product [Hyaloperonospora brassicae]